MRTININFTLNEREYELLCMAKADKPDPQRVKKMLLRGAATQVRRMADDVMQNLHGQPTKSIKWKDLPPARPATLAEIEANNARKLRAIDKTAADRSAKGLYRSMSKKKPNPSDYSAVKVDPPAKPIN